jgi:opacity protein-like surface antigen
VPVFSVGVVGGLNQMDIEVTQRFKMDNFFRASGEYAPDPTVYNLDMGSYMGFQFGVHGDVLLKGRLHLHGEINFKTMRYNYADSMAFGNSLLSYAETQQVVSLPVGLKYNLRNKKIQPYLTLGAIPTGLLSAKSDVKRKIKTGLAAREITGAAVDVYDLRVNQYLLLYGGGGVKIKSMKGFIVLDYKQAYSLSNAVKPEMRYSEPTLVYKYGYIDDNFLFRNAMFSVGYIVSFYKPKILKRL